MKNEWFADWFDSPYYHILYQNHNDRDAQRFINNLLHNLIPDIDKFLDDPEFTDGLTVLDLACGKGRHSRYMASKGLDVTGVDLSENSIAFARQFETKNLNFFQHDMRKAFRINYFDFIFNFFTSFGYFDDERDNLRSLRHVTEGLKPSGIFVFDYLNAQWVRQTLQTDYHQIVEGIDFFIQKHIENGHVIKKISFNSEPVNPLIEGANAYTFEERVRLFSLQEFENLFKNAGLKIIEKFGDYDLNPFDVKTSKRLIIKAIRV